MGVGFVPGVAIAIAVLQASNSTMAVRTLGIAPAPISGRASVVVRAH